MFAELTEALLSWRSQDLHRGGAALGPPCVSAAAVALLLLLCCCLRVRQLLQHVPERITSVIPYLLKKQTQ